MSLFLEAPDSILKVEADFRGESRGNPFFAFRVLFGKNAVTGWCEIPECIDVCEDVPVRVRCRNGSVVVREGTFTVQDTARRSYKLRIALSDGCVVIRASAGKIMPRIVMASAFSCGYVSALNGQFYKLTRAAVEDENCSASLLFYSHGRCSALLRRYGDEAIELNVAPRPADLVVSRRLAAELFLPQLTETVHAYSGSLASCNVRALYLGAKSVCSERLIANHPACLSEVKLEPGVATEVHALSMAVLTSADYDASTGFRGEFGEYFCMARRSGETWTVAAVTVKMRVLTLFFPYLDANAEYDAEWILDDGSVLPDNIEHVTPSVIRAGDKAVVKMPAFGGFVLKLKVRCGILNVKCKA